jgi:hypothetical protein
LFEEQTKRIARLENNFDENYYEVFFEVIFPYFRLTLNDIDNEQFIALSEFIDTIIFAAIKLSDSKAKQNNLWHYVHLFSYYVFEHSKLFTISHHMAIKNDYLLEQTQKACRGTKKIIFAV